jgi:hypothetical protein
MCGGICSSLPASRPPSLRSGSPALPLCEGEGIWFRVPYTFAVITFIALFARHSQLAMRLVFHRLNRPILSHMSTTPPRQTRPLNKVIGIDEQATSRGRNVNPAIRYRGLCKRENSIASVLLQRVDRVGASMMVKRAGPRLAP